MKEIQSLFASHINKLTSYNNNFRGKYAGQGDTYDPDLDQFTDPIDEE